MVFPQISGRRNLKPCLINALDTKLSIIKNTFINIFGDKKCNVSSQKLYRICKKY